MNGPRIGELFAGYGGLGMGVKAVLGGEVAWYSDVCKFDKDGKAGHYDPHRGPCRIWGHHYPDVPNIGDIAAVNWSKVEPVDVLTGGFPCQDVSAAGKRAGIRPGTRSGLWSHFAYAIDQLRPQLVVIENVRGLLSAEAHSDVEPCPWCVGDDADGALRALGAVLGDLAGLGFDAEWVGLRAADVGAPHGRFRIFIVAYPASDPGRLVNGDDAPTGHASRLRWVGRVAHGALGSAPVEGVVQLPVDGFAGGVLPGVDLEELADVVGGLGGEGDCACSGHASTEHRHGTPDKKAESKNFQLLPTPAVNDMGEGKTVEAWDEWTAKMKAAHGNGNGHGASLAIEAQRLLPTPKAHDAEFGTPRTSGRPPENATHLATAVEFNITRKQGDAHVRAAEGGSREELPSLQEVRQREARGSERLPAPEVLQPELCEHTDGDHAVRSPAPGEATPQGDVPGVRRDEPAARTSPRPQLAERRPDEPDDAVRVVPPEAALAGGSGAAHGCCEASRRDGACPWGPYSAAIHRWEMVLGRLAPPATELGPKGNPRLSAHFSEFLMGLPAGWITDVPGVTRNEALKLAGNGIVWQQAEAAIRYLLTVTAVAA